MIYEVVWARYLQIIFGSTVYTASTIFAAFLLGFSLGSFFARRTADNTEKPLLFLALIEIFIGLYGICLLFVFRFLPGIYTHLPDSLPLKLLFCAAILLIPSTLFGATWPFITRYYIDRVRKVGRGTGDIYSVNSLGSAAGAMASGFFLAPLFGLKATSLIAAILNIFLGILILVIKNEEK